MFEKCGLRDIFVRIGRLKWLILVVVLAFAAIGSVKYVGAVKDYKAQTASKEKYSHTMYAGYAYYSLHVDVSGSDTTVKRSKTTVASYVKTFSLKSVSNNVYQTLLENHDKEELGALLDAERYAEKDVNRYNLYKKSYGLRGIAANSILELRVCAETRDMCRELLNACSKELRKIAKNIIGSSIRLQGMNVRKVKVDSKFFPKKTYSSTTTSTSSADEITIEEDDQTEETVSAPGVSSIAVWALIGLLVGIVIAIGAAIFRPSINRASDFEMYDTKPLGQPGKNSSALTAHLVLKILKDNPASDVVFATSLAGNKKLKEYFEKVKAEMLRSSKDTAELRISLAEQPNMNAESSDLCEKGEIIFALEKKGVTAHYKYETMQNYIEVLDKKIYGAFLLA